MQRNTVKRTPVADKLKRLRVQVAITINPYIPIREFLTNVILWNSTISLGKILVKVSEPTLSSTKTSKPAMRSIVAALRAARGRAQGRCLSKDLEYSRVSGSISGLFFPGILNTETVLFGAGTLMTLATLARPFLSIATSLGTRKNSVDSS